MNFEKVLTWIVAYFSYSCTLHVFRIITATNVILFFQKALDNTIYYISLQWLPNRNQGHLFSRRSFLSVLASTQSFHCSILCFNSYQMIPLFSFSLANISFVFSFYVLSPILFSFHITLFIQVLLLHSITVRSTATSSPFYSIYYTAESALHAVLTEYTMFRNTCCSYEITQTTMPKDLVVVMSYKAPRCMPPVVDHVLFCNDEAVPCKFVTQKTCQWLLASMATSAHTSNDGWIRELVTFLFRNCMVGVNLVNKCRLLQLITQLNRGKTEFYFMNMTNPTIYGVIIFIHFFSVFSDGLLKQTLTDGHSYAQARK